MTRPETMEVSATNLMAANARGALLNAEVERLTGDLTKAQDDAEALRTALLDIVEYFGGAEKPNLLRGEFGVERADAALAALGEAAT